MSFSQSQSVSMSEGGSVNLWKKKAKKYDCRKDEMALAPVPWSETRKKPEFVPGIWEDEEIEDLSRYIDWHRQHPHCITPRPVKEDEDFRAADKKLDEGNSKLVYTKMPGHIPPTPKEYLPVYLGADCDTDTISVIATEKEYSTVVHHKFELEDPWYMMSVKDQLEQSHIDGDHTTVKTRRSAASTVASEFNREAAWQKANYGSYEGGFPAVTQRNLQKLSELALADKSALHKPAAKVGPWDTKRDFSRFTKHGTALKDYQKLALERNVAAALAEHERDLIAERAALRAASSRKSSRRSKKRSRAKSGQVVPEEAADKYEAMRRQVGTHKQIEKMTRGFVRLAKKVASHSKLQKNALETKMDLVEACNKLRTARVQAMLLLESTDPNMKTPEDEPILLHMFARGVRVDQVSGHQRLGGEGLSLGQEQDSGDRKRVGQILRALLGRADVNIYGREGLTAAHLAAKGDSSKLLALLCEHKADLELLSKHDEGGMTPLMMADKYGHVYICAELVLHQVDINKQNALGLTALHYAGMFGQTRTAKFLLRVGADKFLRDNEGRTAGRLASDRDFMASGQAISAFAVPKRDVASQLEYLVEQEAKRRRHPEGLLGALSRTRSFFDSLTMANMSSGLGRVAAAVHWHLRRWFWRAVKEVCDYFEIDYEVPELGDGGPDDEHGGDAEEEEDEDGEEGGASEADQSTNGGAADDSEGTSRRGTAVSAPEGGAVGGVQSSSLSRNGKAGGGTGAGSAAGFDGVDGFASVKVKPGRGGAQGDDVIGFHDDF